MENSMELPFQESLFEDDTSSNRVKDRKERLAQSREQFEEQRRIYARPKVESFSTIMDVTSKGTSVTLEEYQAAQERARYNRCVDPPKPRHLCDQEKGQSENNIK